jgi:hypothetical protein
VIVSPESAFLLPDDLDHCLTGPCVALWGQSRQR